MNSFSDDLLEFLAENDIETLNDLKSFFGVDDDSSGYHIAHRNVTKYTEENQPITVHESYLVRDDK